MAITLRTNKGAKLTFEELDGNFVDLDSRVKSLETTQEDVIDYNNLQNKPTLFSGDYDDLTNKPDLSVYQLAADAFSESYNDLTDQPFIPTDVNQLSDVENLLTTASDADTLDGQQGSYYLDYSNFTNTPTIPADVSDLTDTTNLIPADVSDLTDTTNLIPQGLLDLGISDGTSGQFLTTNGSGTFTFTSVPVIQSLGDIGNVSTNAPSTGQVLKWSGTEWAPASDAVGDTGAGITLADLSVSTAVAGSPSLSYDNSTGTFTYTPPDLSSYITSIPAEYLTQDEGDARYVQAETVTSLSLATNTLSYTDENGDTTDIDLSLYLDDTNLARLTSGTLNASTGIATFTRDDASTFTVDFSALLNVTLADLSVTSNAASGTGALSYDNTTGEFTYTPPDLSSYITSISTFDIGNLSNVSSSSPSTGQVLKWDGAQWAPRTDSVSSTAATLEDFSVVTNAAGTAALSYSSEFGVFTFTPPDLSSYLTSETVTSLSLATNTLSYTDENGDTTDIDLSLYLDDTNLARLTSGTLDAGTGIATFTRDDASTFTVDFSALLNVTLADLSVGADASASGTGGISYNNTTGVFTYTPPDLSGYLTSYTETDPVVGAVSGIVKADGAGNISAAVAGTDYLTSVAFEDLTSTPTTLAGYGITDSYRPVRDTASATTSSIADGVAANVTITGVARTYALLKIETDQAAWVTLYTDTSSRTLDATRTEDTDPEAGSGVLAEIITTGAATQIITPGTFGWNNDASPSDNVYAKVVNKSGITTTITVTLTFVPMEV